MRLMQGLLGLRTLIALGILIPALRGWMWLAVSFTVLVIALTLVAIGRLYRRACVVSGRVYLDSAASLATALVNCPVCNASGMAGSPRWWASARSDICFFCRGRGQVPAARTKEIGL